ncbi:hypothetical protein F8S13_12710 [Chloroflexia bacterium SDU3-3]|nr:hypothetical protein F8S13_12710 [Chloroflexia bacterium SDU3-3]
MAYEAYDQGAGRAARYAAALGLCALTGARSAGPAALVRLLGGGRGGQALSAALAAAALGELVGDKLPTTPDRTSPPALAGRVAIGGGLGALLWHREGGAAWCGAVAGAAAAALGTYATYHLRRWLGRALAAPDPLLGAAEDALVLGAGAWLARRLGAGLPSAS